MAKTDKSNKKGTSKKADPIKEKLAVPASSKEILAKAAALAKPTSKKAANGKKIPSASSDDSSDASSAEDSSSGESSEEASPPAKSTPAAVKKTADFSDDSSDASSSEESSSEENDTSKKRTVSAPMKTTPAPVKRATDDSSSSEESSSEDGDDDKKMASVPAKTSPTKTKKKTDSEDDSAASSFEESSGDSDEEDKPPAPAQTAPAEVNKKRKVDSEADAPPKKVKLANDSANVLTSGEEIRSIFVGRLSWNVDNDWLAQEFVECGEVESAHVQMDRNTGRSRGFGYVHFKTADAVEKAIALNGKEIDGRAVNIDKSNPRDKNTSVEKRAQAFGDTSSPPSATLFVGNLSFGVNEDTLWETFGEHGDVKSVRVPTDRDSGKPKGFAYVEFSEVGAAKKAHAGLQGFELDGRSIRLDFSQPRDSAGGRGGGQGSRGGRGRGGFGGDRFGGDRGRGGGRGGRGGDRGRGGRGRGARTGGITHFEGQKITF